MWLCACDFWLMSQSSFEYKGGGGRREIDARSGWLFCGESNGVLSSSYLTPFLERLPSVFFQRSRWIPYINEKTQIPGTERVINRMACSQNQWINCAVYTNRTRAGWCDCRVDIVLAPSPAFTWTYYRRESRHASSGHNELCLQHIHCYISAPASVVIGNEVRAFP